MPNEIVVKRTNTGFFTLFMDGQEIGTYGNPCKALNVAIDLMGYNEERDEYEAYRERHRKSGYEDPEG